MRSNAPKARTRQALWNLKIEKPHLFAQQGQQQSSREDDEDVDWPPGFEACGQEGWLWHAGRNLFLEKATGRLCWFDEAANEYKEAREGSALSLSFSGGATATWSGPDGAGSSSSASKPKQPKHLVIPDLHRVAQAMKADLAHLDRPTSVLAVFGTEGGVPADQSARVFHERLIRRLAASRGEWPDQALCEALAGVFSDIASSYGGQAAPDHLRMPSAAAVLAVGHRVVAAAAPGARYCFLAAGRSPTAAPATGPSAAPVAGAGTSIVCQAIGNGADATPVCVMVAAGDLRLSDDVVAAAAGSQLMKGRPRAASVALLQGARQQQKQDGPCFQLAAGCIRLSPVIGAAATVLAEPPTKRQKSEVTPSKVRVRQILLRHWRGTGPKPTDPVRKTAVSRSPEEAETTLLSTLDGLVADGCAGFSAACRSLSECQSALKGGELAGDLGWLDPPVSQEELKKQAAQKKQGPSSPAPGVRSAVPDMVCKAAFALEVGELGDLIHSDVGVHILLRTA